MFNHKCTSVNYTHSRLGGRSSRLDNLLMDSVLLGGSAVLADLVVLGVDASSDVVDLIDFCSDLVTLLASPAHGDRHTEWMPSTDMRKPLSVLRGSFLVTARQSTISSCPNTLATGTGCPGVQTPIDLVLAGLAPRTCTN